MVSIKDIAKALSVSPSSVSLVLTGKAKERRISNSLAEKILAMAHELGYQPNQAAVSLRTGKSKTIGLIVEDISNHFFSSLAHTIEQEARNNHYNVIYCSTENDVQKGREVLQLMYNQQVDGYLITPAIGMEKDIEKLVQLGKPVVLMDRNIQGMNLPSVMVDNYKGMQQAMRYLCKKGNRNIGFVTVNLDLFQMKERERAYYDALREAGLRVLKSHVLHLEYQDKKEKSVANITAFLKKQKNLDAVIFATNYLGIYGLLSTKEIGLRIPEDLKILCFDDHDVFELHQPSITVVQQPIQEIAKTALELLLKQLGHLKTPKKSQFLLPPKLVVRSST